MLFESDVKDGYMHGFTKNYVKVRTPYDPLLVNEVIPVKMISISEKGEVDIQEMADSLIH